MFCLLKFLLLIYKKYHVSGRSSRAEVGRLMWIAGQLSYESCSQAVLFRKKRLRAAFIQKTLNWENFIFEKKIKFLYLKSIKIN